MTNREISRKLKLAGDLLELHNGNEFKIRAYRNAAFSIDRLEKELVFSANESIATLEGIGKSMVEHIRSLLSDGSFVELDTLSKETPEGVLDMLEIKGLGPKKVSTLWRDHSIDSVEKLMDACKTHTIASIKGFGSKTEESILKAIEAQASYEGLWLYADLEPLATQIMELLLNNIPFLRLEPTGAYRRKVEVIEQLEFLAITPKQNVLDDYAWPEVLEPILTQSGPYLWRLKHSVYSLTIWIHLTSAEQWANDWMRTTGSIQHLHCKVTSGTSVISHLQKKTAFQSEEAIYQSLGVRYMEPVEREGYREFDCDVSRMANLSDLQGILHNHSTYSDGKHTLQEMAQRCKEMGYTYFGIADHSKSAFYANGLQEEKVYKQWQEIDTFNQTETNFRIFKGIESDILNDGSLDYTDDILAGFDYVVASVHSNLRMDMTKATNRILKAIEQPYTSILGHISGRLLLRREGYPLDYQRILDAMKHHEVILELNADPWRLDIDWRYLYEAEKRGIYLSINPDAHEVDGLQNIRFGYYAARKACYPKELIINTKSCEDIADFFRKKK
jgi:DNA polymerase (family 10)